MYSILDNGELVLITPEHDGVAIVCVPRDKRLLEQPLGLAKHDKHPWTLAIPAEYQARDNPRMLRDWTHPLRIERSVCFFDLGEYRLRVSS
ncbi:MAG TPA: hypothetical protein PK156_08255 [Polyangium sp.]|nr:hypothetical protein [Polyangium sp.]